jgi:cytochrome b involved in lipid metabolism
MNLYNIYKICIKIKMKDKSSTETDNKNYPPPYKKKRYYTPEEVRVHNTANDCWVSFFNEVFDLTELIDANFTNLMDPIIKNAGTDITHWFDASTKDVIYYKLFSLNFM